MNISCIDQCYWLVSVSKGSKVGKLGPVERDDKSREKTLRPVKHACLIFRYLKLVLSKSDE